MNKALFICLALAQAQEVEVAAGDNWVAKVQQVPNSDDTVRFQKDGDGGGNFEYTVPEKVQTWDLENDICWVSQQPKQRAQPSLRTCYITTEQSCCNFVVDDQIGAYFSSFLPGPCLGDYKEIEHFQCVACRGQSTSFTIKAEPT